MKMRKGKHLQVFHDHALSSRPATEGCCQDIYPELGDYIYHLLTETEGNSVFCGPETAVVVEGPQNTLLSRGLSK
jgi:hypothetical protein